MLSENISNFLCYLYVFPKVFPCVAMNYYGFNRIKSLYQLVCQLRCVNGNQANLKLRFLISMCFHYSLDSEVFS